MNSRREYSLLAPVYDLVWRRYVRVTTARTVAITPVRAHARVLDVGCGTGVLLDALARAPVPLRLSGVDLTPRMLAAAGRRLAGAAELAVGDAARLPFEDDVFDVVVSSSVLHELPRPGEGLDECARVLAPGGTLVVTDWRADDPGTRSYVRALSAVGLRKRPLAAGELLGGLRDRGLRPGRASTYRVDGWGIVTAAASA
jgi:ubiquinone/menaquinone biosynthesis C-methylase UbiE